MSTKSRISKYLAGACGADLVIVGLIAMAVWTLHGVFQTHQRDHAPMVEARVLGRHCTPEGPCRLDRVIKYPPTNRHGVRIRVVATATPKWREAMYQPMINDLEKVTGAAYTVEIMMRPPATSRQSGQGKGQLGGAK